MGRAALLLTRRLAPLFAALVAALVAAFVAAFLTGCAPRALPDAAFEAGAVVVDCCGRASEPVELTYLGVGGWLVRMGDRAVLTAPFYSNPSLWEAGLATLRADPDRIDAHLPDVRDVPAILVGHGHYDHLMDVPWILRHRAPQAVVYGNRTVAHQLAPFGFGPDRVRVVGDSAGTVERAGRWIRVAEGVRVMPLVSDHSPHLAGMVLYSGRRTRDMRDEPQSAEEWLAGRTLAWLIDLLEPDGRVALRIYYQDAVAAAPYGFVPPLDDGVPVDVALLVPATYSEVAWHPEAIVDNTRPRQVLLGHWEDFFQAPSHEADPVLFMRLPGFVARLERALPPGSAWHLPRPGTRYLFH